MITRLGRQAFAIAAIVTCLGGCSPRVRLIAGQVFITSGTSTIRLPLTKIRVLDLGKATELLRIMKQERDVKLAEIAKEIAATEAEIQSFDAAQQPALANAQTADAQFNYLYLREHELEDLMHGPPIGFENYEAAMAQYKNIREQMDTLRRSLKPEKELKQLVEQEKELLAKRPSLLE